MGVYNGTLKLAVDGIPNASVNVPVTYTIQAPVQKPTISAGGVLDAAGGGKAIAPGSWVSIFGTLLSGTTRAWRDADFQAGRLPTALDGVSVTINGKSAPIAFISPGQINVLAPDDSATGLVPVQVKNAQGASDSVLVLQQTAAPALFQFPAPTYAAATHVDGSYVAGPRLVAQGIPGTAAKVGETIVLFGTGFGVTQPAISATALVPAPLPHRPSRGSARTHRRTRRRRRLRRPDLPWRLPVQRGGPASRRRRSGRSRGTARPADAIQSAGHRAALSFHSAAGRAALLQWPDSSCPLATTPLAFHPSPARTSAGQ